MQTKRSPGRGNVLAACQGAMAQAAISTTESLNLICSSCCQCSHWDLASDPAHPYRKENASATVGALHDEDKSKTAVELRCEPSELPIYVPPNDSIQIMLLNQKARSGGGLFEFLNGDTRPTTWPSKAMLKAHKPGPGETHIYRCDVSNEGNTKLLDIALAFAVNYAPPKQITYPIMINPLGVGKTVTFYMVNACPTYVSVIQPSDYTAQIGGQDNRTTLPLLRPGKNPVEQFMMFFPSSVSWNGEVCD